MRFVPIKNGEQQGVLALHRARQGVVKARTAQANQIRELLAKYGIVVPQGISHIAKRVPIILEDGENDLPGRSASCCSNSSSTRRRLIGKWAN
jgi:transposase